MENRYGTIVLDPVNDFLNELPRTERAKIFSSIDKMRSGNWSSLYIKTLKGPIRELIVKQYRVIFFMSGSVLYFVRAFRKKTAKTPPQEIGRAEHIYKMIAR